jgi:hypothetical protein
LTAGHFLVGNGTGAVNSTPTGTFETTSNAATTYFNQNTGLLPVANGGTNNSTAPPTRTVIFYDGGTNKYTGENILKIGTTGKLLSVCGVAIPSNKLFIADGNDDPTTEFKLKDISDVTATVASNGQVLTYNIGTSQWGPADLPAGLATPISISNGGTNATGPFIADGVVYFNQAATSFASNSNLTFNGTTLTANQISLTTPLSVANGGTNTTGPFTSNGIIYFNGTKVSTEAAFSYTESTNTLSTDTLSLANALTVANGGTGLKTITAGRFLVGDGTNPITTIATGTFETTSNAFNTYLGKSTNVTSLNGTGVFETTSNATNYFNKNTDTLSITRGGTNATGPFLSNGVLYFNQSLTSFDSNSNLTFNGTTLTANQLSLNTALSVANGGTGATGTVAARSNLGLAIGTNVQAHNSKLTDLTNFTNNGSIPVIVAGSYADLIPADATSFGKVLRVVDYTPEGSPTYGPYWSPFRFDNLIDVDPTLTAVTNGQLISYDTGVSKWKAITTIPIANGGTGATGATQARSNLGLGSLAVLNDLALTSLKDVTATVPTNGQVLSYDTAISRWKPATISPGGSETWTTTFLTTNSTNDTTGSVAAGEILFSVVTGTVYSYIYNVAFDCKAANGFIYKISDPGVTTHYWNIDFSRPGSVFSNKSCKAGTGQMTDQTAALDGNDGLGYLRIEGIINPSSNGAIQFEFKLNSGSDPATIYTGSYVKYAPVSN